MSQENVDVLRASIEAFNRGDFEGVLRCLDPEVRFEHRLGVAGSFVGIDGVGWLADLFEHFATGQVHCPDIRDLGDRVLALGTVRAWEGEWRRDRVAVHGRGQVQGRPRYRFTDFGDRDKALEAAGLSE